MRIEPELRRFERHVESAISWQPSRLRYRCARRCMVSTALFLLPVSLTGCSEKEVQAAAAPAGSGGCVGRATGRSRLRRVGGTTERSRERRHYT